MVGRDGMHISDSTGDFTVCNFATCPQQAELKGVSKVQDSCVPNAFALPEQSFALSHQQTNNFV
jgi:hypothetical protein